MPCVPKEGCSGKRVATLMLRGSWNPDAKIGESSREEKQRHQAHMNHLAEKENASEFHCGVVHKPITIKDKMMMPDAEASVDKELDILELASLGWLNRRRTWFNKRRITVLFCISHRSLASESRRTCQAPPKFKDSVAFGGTPSNTLVATVQYARSKEHQLRKWQQQDTCIQFCRLPGMAGEANDAISAYTQVHTSEAPILLRLREKECPRVLIRLSPSRRPKQGDSIEEPAVPLGRDPYGYPLSGLLWERKLE